MPELPELEVLRRGLQDEVIGKTVSDAIVNKQPCVNPKPPAYQKAMVGAKITAARRNGKIVLLDLDNGHTLLLHLGLGGRIVLRDSLLHDPDQAQIVIAFQDGSALHAERLMFGNIHVLPTDKLNADPRIGNAGPDALDELPSAAQLRDIYGKRKSALKALLLDQSALSGIGNMYSNEILHRARLHPQTLGAQLTDAELQRLHDAIHDALTAAIADGGASETNFTDLHGNKGRHLEHLRVQGRAGEACPECGTTIKELRVSGRPTFICPKCQRKKPVRRRKK